jgi:histidyl-tRNA synthetase
MKIERPKGTRDFAPIEMSQRRYVERAISGVFENYGFRQIKTPTFEHLDLFQLKSGEDITTHLFSFEDKKERAMCLRPEATAPVCRMYAETLRNMPMPIKVYYFDSMFRYEEPQKGRYREFWQLGLELIGPKGAMADAEVVSLAYNSLKSLGLKFRLELSHLGIIKGLLESLKLGEEKQRKVIAAIDKKDIEAAKKIVHDKVLFDLLDLSGRRCETEKAKALLMGSEKAETALAELEEITKLLDALKVEYVINYGVARGLEYYTGMVFEIRVDGLGAQNQICGGGRYDNLIELFSGMAVPAVGVAFGFDRVVEAMQQQGIELPAKKTDVVVAPVSADVRSEALKIAADLRNDFVVDVDLMDRKLGKILEYAGQISAGYAVIIGKKDLENSSLTLRDMHSGDQETVPLGNLKSELKKRIKK